MQSIWKAKYYTQRDMFKNCKLQHFFFPQIFNKTKNKQINKTFCDLEIANNKIIKLNICQNGFIATNATKSLTN